MKISQKTFTHVQLIAVGFLLIILTGTLLLMLPISSASGQVTPPLTALFTATSASCVTGLILVNTAAYWSPFGKIVLLIMIQIGGLGFISFGVYFSMILRRRIGLWQRTLIQESINALEIGGIVRLVRKILFGTLLFETTGALLLATRFIPRFGWRNGTLYAIFHSISAFCNAGFDLFGTSLMDFSDDPVVILTISALILIGGIGFIVWNDLSIEKFHFKKYSLHTKIVLTVTIGLTVVGSLLFYLYEKNALFAHMGPMETFLSSVFASITPRTAGFNSVDTGSYSGGSVFLTYLLMFIGGSPGSTAGGVKTTTIFVLAVFVYSNILGRQSTDVFHRRITEDALSKATSVMGVYLLFLSAAVLIINLADPHLSMDTILFEVISAICTVGMTMGITDSLSAISQIVLILLMFGGRLGSLSFALIFAAKHRTAKIKNPIEKISIG